MKKNGLLELKFENQEFSIHLNKGIPPVMQFAGMPVATAAGQATENAPGKEENDLSAELDSYYSIAAPMAGTFYRAPSPTSPPYVKEGDMIAEGDVLCIIEAMKLMNEVKSDISGRIVRILGKNAELVSEGQVIFLIDPS